jgi:hypothetical protein
VFVAGKAAEDACARGNFTPYFAETIVFGADLARVSQRPTWAAGHYTWPLDEDGDGRAEAVFVGKYLLRPDGTTRCVLPGFGVDHVDSMVVGDLDPATAGLEALTVGTSGTRFFAAGGCASRWTIPNRALRGVQQAAAAYLRNTAGGAPDLLVTTKLPAAAGDRTQRVYALDTRGGVVRSYAQAFAAPVQNANLDGAPQAEDRVISFGQVVDRSGRVRLGTAWYWGLQELTPEEAALDPLDQWTRTPFAFDLDDDGRDELVVWGRRKLVVGTLAPGAAGQGREGSLTPERARKLEAYLLRRLEAARGQGVREETRARLMLLAFRSRHAALLARPAHEAAAPPGP